MTFNVQISRFSSKNIYLQIKSYIRSFIYLHNLFQREWKKIKNKWFANK